MHVCMCAHAYMPACMCICAYVCVPCPRVHTNTCVHAHTSVYAGVHLLYYNFVFYKENCCCVAVILSLLIKLSKINESFWNLIKLSWMSDNVKLM